MAKIKGLKQKIIRLNTFRLSNRELMLKFSVLSHAICNFVNWTKRQIRSTINFKNTLFEKTGILTEILHPDPDKFKDIGYKKL